SVQSEQRQVAWQGSLQVNEVQAQQVGRTLGQDWPDTTLSANLRYDGKGTGPMQVDGSIDARNVRVGAVHLRTVAGSIVQARWNGSDDRKPAPTWRECLRDVTAEVRLDQVQGETSIGLRQFAVSHGILTLHDGSLAIRGLSGTYGKSARLRGGEIVASTVASRTSTEVSAVFETDVSLRDDLDELFSMLV